MTREEALKGLDMLKASPGCVLPAKCVIEICEALMSGEARVHEKISAGSTTGNKQKIISLMSALACALAEAGSDVEYWDVGVGGRADNEYSASFKFSEDEES